METPKRKVNKLAINYTSSTPKKERDISFDNDYSPLFMSSTQDCIDSVDVVWDWNSPQARGITKVENHPPKRYSSRPSTTSNSLPSNTIDTSKHLASFNKLKEQLERLRSQLILDNAEKVTKDATSNNVINKCESPRRSVHALHKPKNLLTKSFSSESLGNSFFENDFNLSDIIIKSTNMKSDNSLQSLDSLDIDIALNEFQEEDYELLSQAIPVKTNELNTTNRETESRHILKRTIQSTNSITNAMPITKQYSQEEIDKKRKLAMAKLEQRRIEDIIERKRQQALIRLESSRKKNLKKASVIKRFNSS